MDGSPPPPPGELHPTASDCQRHPLILDGLCACTFYSVFKEPGSCSDVPHQLRSPSGEPSNLTRTARFVSTLALPPAHRSINRTAEVARQHPRAESGWEGRA